jgi:UDP-4-amino-4,6-dideoxy-N-acetyl-beta-L-altrosamine N-acetyltransferase
MKNFTELTHEEKLLVLNWRNNSNIRQYMHNQEIISLENHLKFIEKLKTDKTKEYFLVSDLGVIDFQRIDGGFAEIGLYSNPEKFGIGKILMEKILQFPYKHLYLEVFSDNIKAIKLYKKFDFKETGREKIEGGELIIMELKK